MEAAAPRPAIPDKSDEIGQGPAKNEKGRPEAALSKAAKTRLAAGTRQVLAQDVRARGRRARSCADPLRDRSARASGAVAARHVRELVLAGAQLGLQAAFGDDLHFTRGGDLRRVA